MPMIPILCELAGALLVAAGNERGSRALLRRPVLPAPRRLARIAGFGLLGTALWVLIRDDGNLLFALTAWALSCGWAFVAAALACTIRDRNSARAPVSERVRTRQNATDTVP
ncbi:hypothetical protein ACMAUO_12175 [Gluconacetobacter sp. Hr-1-5]|uniref:hypothetical protein n=1 Tax=Gluconacetobacter sp. Hr-1-5 TaxID=3395370 RepID=UPI003B5249C1